MERVDIERKKIKCQLEARLFIYGWIDRGLTLKEVMEEISEAEGAEL